MFSKIECRETEDASVLLPSVGAACAGCVGGLGRDAEAVTPLLPVMSRRLKDSTSIAAFPVPAGEASLADFLPSVRSSVANVLLNGFIGALPSLPTTFIGGISSLSSSDDSSDTTASNGSWPSARPSSPCASGGWDLWSMASSGLLGGGDCTLTCFTGFSLFFIGASPCAIGRSIGSCLVPVLSSACTPFSVFVWMVGVLRRKGFEEP